MAPGADGGPRDRPLGRGPGPGQGEEAGRHGRVPRGHRLRAGHRRLLWLQRGWEAAGDPQEGARRLREEAPGDLQEDHVPAADVRGYVVRGPGRVQGEDVRAGALAALALAVALGASCKTYKDNAEPLPPGYEAGIYEAAPGRQVDDG